MYSVDVISRMFQVNFSTFVSFPYPLIASAFMKNLSKCCRYNFPNFSFQFLAGFFHLKPLSRRHSQGRRQWRNNSCCRCAAKESKNSLHLLAAFLALGFVFFNLKKKLKKFLPQKVVKGDLWVKSAPPHHTRTVKNLHHTAPALAKKIQRLIKCVIVVVVCPKYPLKGSFSETKSMYF